MPDFELDINQYEELVDQMNQPPIKEGKHLAFITSLEEKFNPSKKSYGISFKLAVNVSEDIEMWDAAGRTFDVTYYCWIGRRDDMDSPVTFGDKGVPFSLMGLYSAIGASADKSRLKITDDYVGRVVVVTIKHEPDDEGRNWARVDRLAPFSDPMTGEIAPKMFAGAIANDTDPAF